MQCVDVHYIEFFSERMFMEPTLNAKVRTYRNDTAILTFELSPLTL